MARGMTFSALRVSPDVVPTSSMPAYANTTPCTTMSAGSTPDGKRPPLSRIRENPTSEPVGVPNSTKNVPMTRKTTRARTLIRENQNSSSPNTLTETRFSDTTRTTTINARIHCGIPATNALY